jgi:hypothetical protein
MDREAIKIRRRRAGLSTRLHNDTTDSLSPETPAHEQQPGSKPNRDRPRKQPGPPPPRLGSFSYPANPRVPVPNCRRQTQKQA